MDGDLKSAQPDGSLRGPTTHTIGRVVVAVADFVAAISSNKWVSHSRRPLSDCTAALPDAALRGEHDACVHRQARPKQQLGHTCHFVHQTE